MKKRKNMPQMEQEAKTKKGKKDKQKGKMPKGIIIMLGKKRSRR